jgi:sirohydrochlorin cobaltochelatase
MPGVVDEACRRHPSLDLRLAPSIGFDHRLIEILQQRIADAQGGAPALAVEDVTVLLVGRGSTDREANRVFHSVGEVLSREVAFRGVRCCFVSLAEPDVVAGIQACVATGARRVLVMPYFVHSGILVTRIGEQSTVARARFPETEIVVGRPFGAHPHLVALIWERARSTLWSLPDSTPNEPMANSARAST